MVYLLIRTAYEFGLITWQVIGIAACNLGFIPCAWLLREERVKDYSQIIPMPMDEFRRDQTSRKRHIQTISIALGSFLVALAGILVSILAKR
jgi:hypothetical protein